MNEITQAEQKLIVQFQKWFKSAGIEEKVIELRQEISIPSAGIPLTDNDLKQSETLLLFQKNCRSRNVAR